MNKIRLTAGLFLSILILSCQKDPGSEDGNGGGKSDRFSVAVSLPQNAGKAAWTKSDRIRLYIQDGSLSAPSATLSPEGEGASVTFSASSVKDGSEYWLLYPDGAAIIAGTSSMYAVVPASQNAVSGGVDETAFLAAGSTKNRSGNVSLQALTSWLKFSLTGEGVGKIKKITLSADTYVAGDVKISGFGGTLSVASDDTRERAGQHSTVTMTGSFQAGSAYGFSLVPGPAKNFRLIFEDAEGHTQRVEKNGTLAAGKTLDLGNVEIGSFDGPSPFEALFTATKEGIKPYVIVFMADGFTEAERDKYQQAAEAAIDFMFSVQPFREFKEYFSAYIGWKASKESGPGQTWGTVTTGGGMGSYGQARRCRLRPSVRQSARLAPPSPVPSLAIPIPGRRRSVPWTPAASTIPSERPSGWTPPRKPRRRPSPPAPTEAANAVGNARPDTPRGSRPGLDADMKSAGNVQEIGTLPAF